MCWSVKDLPSFYCLLYSCVLVGYGRLLFHERFVTDLNELE